MAALKLNMAAAKPEVVLTSAPEAILTPFPMRIMCFRTHKLNRSVIKEALLKVLVIGAGISAIPVIRSEL